MLIPDLNREVHPEYVKGLVAFIDFARDFGKTDSVFDMAEGYKNTESNQLATQYMKSQPGVEQIIQERYLAATPDITALLKLPENSLGYIYAYKMKQANFDPEFYRKVNVQDDTTYLALRLRQTHDIWHAVTGFGTDLAGEVGLQGFYLAQTHAPLSMSIMAGGILNTLLKDPKELTYVMHIMVQGYDMGIKSKPLLAQKWEEYWEKPLTEWRMKLGVEGVN